MRKLNAKQIEAIKSPINQSGLVIAGAGSGKTSVLTQRIHYLVNEQNIPPYNIMAMTFTNKAAREIKDRLINLQTNVAGMWLGTFHSMGYRIIKQYPDIIDMPKSCYVVDTKEQKKYIKQLLSSQGYDTKSDLIDDVFKTISQYKEAGKRANKVKKDPLYDFYKMYEEGCRHDGVLDFGELLLGSYEIINHPDSKQYFQNRFEFILVDEFQDTNLFQYKWLLSMTETHKNIFVVGDFDQSIYSFRGAVPDNLFRIENDYSPINTIKLEQNYRSEKYILEAANSIIKNNKTRHDKTLWTDNESYNVITYKSNETDEEEVKFVAEKIRELIREGYDYKDMAILYRTNFLSQQMEKSLLFYNIPFIIYGGLRFFERQEVKNTIAYLRIAHDPHDNMAFLRACNVPSRGIGNKSIDKLISYSQENSMSLYESIEFMDTKTQSKFEVFQKIIDYLHNISYDKDLLKKIDTIINHCGLIEYYEGKKEEERVDNINEIWASAQYFVRDNPNSTFDDFINMTTLDADFEKAKDEKTKNNVNMMTVHSAKGMEFPVVFVIGLNNGIFPHAFAKNQESLEEERRMMYVAVTRAKEKLFLSQSKKRFMFRNVQIMKPSHFISEIPNQLMKKEY